MVLSRPSSQFPAPGCLSLCYVHMTRLYSSGLSSRYSGDVRAQSLRVAGGGLGMLTFPLFSHCSRCSWPSESHLGQVNLTPMYTSVVSCSDVVVNMAPPCSPFCSFSWCVCSFNKLLIPLQGRGVSALRGSSRDLPVAVYRTHPPNSCIGTRPSITC